MTTEWVGIAVMAKDVEGASFAYLVEHSRYVLILPPSEADRTSGKTEPDSRQVLDWDSQKLGFIDLEAQVIPFKCELVKLTLTQTILPTILTPANG